MMRMMATLTFDQSQRAAIVALIPAEQDDIRELIARGTVETVYVAADQARAWIVLRGASEAEVRHTLESLPMAPYESIELAALAGA
jgi:muconolactone delta-isomerase